MSVPRTNYMASVLGEIELTTHLRNQLLCGRDWTRMDDSTELRTALMNAYRLQHLQPVLSALRRYSRKSLRAHNLIEGPPPKISRSRQTGSRILVRRWNTLTKTCEPGAVKCALGSEIAETYRSTDG